MKIKLTLCQIKGASFSNLLFIQFRFTKTSYKCFLVMFVVRTKFHYRGYLLYLPKSVDTTCGAQEIFHFPNHKF